MKKLTNQELIEKLNTNIKLHLRPYNLGDMGETEMLINELICRFEKSVRDGGLQLKAKEQK